VSDIFLWIKGRYKFTEHKLWEKPWGYIRALDKPTSQLSNPCGHEICP
jgi:hypothetical protein